MNKYTTFLLIILLISFPALLLSIAWLLAILTSDINVFYIPQDALLLFGTLFHIGVSLYCAHLIHVYNNGPSYKKYSLKKYKFIFHTSFIISIILIITYTYLYISYDKKHQYDIEYTEKYYNLYSVKDEYLLFNSLKDKIFFISKDSVKNILLDSTRIKIKKRYFRNIFNQKDFNDMEPVYYLEMGLKDYKLHKYVTED